MLEFSVLGSIGCSRDGVRVELGGPQQRRMLAVLLSDAGRVVPLDRMIEAIWADDPPERARRTTMSYVSRLRSALGDGVVITAEPGYRMDPGQDCVDAVRFERLVERSRRVPPSEAIAVLDKALGLWRGPAYGEFAGEWWALPHAARLDGLRLMATAERIDALLSVGERSRAVTDLEALVPAHPLSERLVAQLMRAYDADGRKAEALRTFHDHRERLADETGLAPGAALTSLEQAILLGTEPAPAGVDRTLRGYVLGDVLGQGANGTVYRSVQPGVDREVAVKVIRADRADDPAFVQRFEAEAQLVAHLEHPHIVPLYDFWREPGGAYLVFRLLRGGTAQEALVADGAWPLERVSRLVDEVGSALMAAHAAGVVHRDVKPSNILFDSTGNAYLVDFGIATDRRPTPGQPFVSSPHSPIYAPPEAFRDHEATPTTDQYSLAVVVYELLTGAAPFAETPPAELVGAKLAGSVPTINGRRPELPAGIDEVLQRATATQGPDRYPDMATMIHEWRGAVRVSTTSTGNGHSPTTANDQGRVTNCVGASPGFVPNPYVGLRAFSEADAQDFRGRDGLADELADAVRSTGMAVVVGASGGGKSSLVHAGLIPRLRACGDRVVTMVPGEDPQAQLGLALLGVARREHRTAGAADLVRSVAAEDHSALTVIIDQFEELWTLTSTTDRRTFLADLVSLASEPGGSPIRLVLAVRADFFDRPLAEPDLGPLVRDHTFLVTPMTPAELQEAITGPAATLGVAFEPGLDGRLVADTIDAPSSLPLLQFTLVELFARRNGSVIPRTAYDELGGIAGAVSSRAESLYASLDGRDADAARRLLLRLVVPGDGSEDTRRRVRRSDLPDGTAGMADLLERHRLLTGDHDPTTREPTVEVAHESLLRSWPRLRGWLRDDRDALRALQHLNQSAKAWADAGRPESELYRGGRLEVAAGLAAGKPDELSPLELDFVDASRARAEAALERDRRTRRRTHRLLAGTAMALVVAVVAGSVAFVQRREATARADDADVSRLISLSQSLAVTKRDVAALLAVAASRRRPGAATDGALMTALYSDPSFLGDLRAPFAGGGTLAPSRDGRTLWSAPDINGHPAVRWDVPTGRHREVPIPGQGDLAVHTLAPVSDTAAVVVLDDENGDIPEARLARLIDLDAGEELATFDFGPDERAVDLSVSPDGTRVLATSQGTRARPARAIVLSLPDLHELARVDQPGPLLTGDNERWWSQSIWLDDDRVAVGSPTGRILIWNPTTGAIVQRLNDPPAPGHNVANSLRATSDGSTLVAGNDLGDGIMAFDLGTGKAKWDQVADANATMAIDERGGLVYVIERGGGTAGSSRLLAYDLETGTRRPGALDGQHGSVCSTAVITERRVLAAASCNQGSVALFALDGSTPAGPLIAPRGWVTGDGLWSPDGNLVVTLEPFENGKVAIRDLRTGKEQPPASGYQGGPAWFGRDGRMRNLSPVAQAVLTGDPRGGDGTSVPAKLPLDLGTATYNDVAGLAAYAHDEDAKVSVMDPTTGRTIVTVEPDTTYVLGLAISNDGKRLYTAGQLREASVFALPSGDKVGTLDAPRNVVLSPDGTLLVGAEFDGVITFYDAVTLQRVGDPLTGSTAFSNSMQFTPDGRFLITSGLENLLRIWDVETRLQVGPAIPVVEPSAGISPDSKTLAVNTDAGVERISLDRRVLRRAACRNAARNLTANEWRRYIGGTRVALCPA